MIMTPVSISTHGDVALVTIANPPINALSQVVRAGLLNAIETIDADDSILAAVLICDGRTFIAGADITEFDKPLMQPLLPDVINRLERASKPWIAAIHGVALGGGLEVALGCHYRIVNGDAKLGFPEVNLGLIPGAGGTVRLPRLIDCAHAVSMVASGKPIEAQQSKEWGLVDKLVEDNLQDAAIEFARKSVRQPRPETLSKQQPVNCPSAEEWVAILTHVRQKARGQLSPIAAAESVRNAIEKPVEEAFNAERRRFFELKNSDQSKALRYIFFAEKSVEKIPGFDELVDVVGDRIMSACHWECNDAPDEQVLQAMQAEGDRILAEKIVNSAEEIDVVMVNAYGFPRWCGGPMFSRQAKT